MQKAGLEVVVEAGAGVEAGYPDAEYTNKGGKILPDRAEVFRAADIIVQVLCYGSNDQHRRRPTCRCFARGQALIGFLRPLGDVQTVAGDCRHRRHLVLGRADAAHHARAEHGRALLHGHHLPATRPCCIAADTLPRIFPMLTTAAGTITPSRVLVIGAGVAGLQAIATARRLGAVVSAYDLRPAVKEQVQSLGGRFVELPIEAADAQDAGGYAKAQDESFYQRQRELLGKVVAESDVVITTAVVPGKKSPVLVTKEMVAGMAPGSVIVDLAAERGGNCELTRTGEIIVEHGVTIFGAINLASTRAVSRQPDVRKNLTNFLLHMVKDGKLQLNLEDEITRSTLVTHGRRNREPARARVLQPAGAGVAIARKRAQW